MNTMTKDSEGRRAPTIKRNLVFPVSEWEAFTQFVDSMTVGKHRAAPVNYTLSETVTAAIRVMRSLGVERARAIVEAYAEGNEQFFADVADALRRLK